MGMINYKNITKMKRFAYIICILFGFLSSIKAQSHEIEITVKGIRNTTGNILIMAQSDDNSKPIYGLAKAEKGEVIISLKNLSERKYILSAFHDENNNWKLDMDELKRPIEGVAREYYQFKPDRTACTMKLFYAVP